MEEILKYHRLKGKFADSIKNDRITAMSIEEESIVIGTEYGFVHTLNFFGDIFKSFKAHDRSINDVSVDFNGSTIARF